jgi:hypothetical protein
MPLTVFGICCAACNYSFDFVSGPLSNSWYATIFFDRTHRINVNILCTVTWLHFQRFRFMDSWAGMTALTPSLWRIKTIIYAIFSTFSFLVINFLAGD